MNDEYMVSLLEEAKELYEDGAIIEAHDKAIVFCNMIIDYMESEEAEQTKKKSI